jgi:hypothetical protein
MPDNSEAVLAFANYASKSLMSTNAFGASMRALSVVLVEKNIMGLGAVLLPTHTYKSNTLFSEQLA